MKIPSSAPVRVGVSWLGLAWQGYKLKAGGAGGSQGPPIPTGNLTNTRRHQVDHPRVEAA
jgi:hypothetical protein